MTMQQPCQHCGYESPTGARFCRQCGESLIVETEGSAAATRNYGKQESAPSVATYGSGRLPPSVSDAIAGETERYYQNYQAPPVRPPSIPTTAPIKSTIRPWRWFLLLLVLLIGTAIGSLVTTGLMDRDVTPMSPEELANVEAQRRQEEAQRRQEEMQRRQEDINRQLEDRMREAQDRSREAENRGFEALERMREAAQQATEAGLALAPTDEKALDLSQYEYSSATVSRSIRIPGHEMLTMHSPDGFDMVKDFYQKKLGPPLIQVNETWEKKLLFQSSTAPSISVSVEIDYANKGQLKITVLRSPFRILRPEEKQIPRVQRPEEVQSPRIPKPEDKQNPN
jgi:hypothetical protein